LDAVLDESRCFELDDSLTFFFLICVADLCSAEVTATHSGYHVVIGATVRKKLDLGPPRGNARAMASTSREHEGGRARTGSAQREASACRSQPVPAVAKSLRIKRCDLRRNGAH
jgi:hypothetical protein